MENLTFYSTDFAVSLHFLKDGNLVGLFKGLNNKATIYECKGFYYRLSDLHLDIAFFVDWNLNDAQPLFSTAFSGAIELGKAKKELYLNWILYSEPSFENSLLSGSTVLTTSLHESETCSNPHQLKPYPQFQF